MKKIVEFNIERRIIKVAKNRKWLLFTEYESIPMWCLIKYVSGTRVDQDAFGLFDDIEYNYQEVLLKSQDEDYIKQEFKNFTEGLK